MMQSLSEVEPVVQNASFECALGLPDRAEERPFFVPVVNPDVAERFKSAMSDGCAAPPDLRRMVFALDSSETSERTVGHLSVTAGRTVEYPPKPSGRIVPDAPEELFVRETRVTPDELEELPVRGARIVPDAPEKLLVRETRVTTDEPEDLAMRETRVTADEPEELPVRETRVVPDASEKLLVRDTRVTADEPEDLAMRETRVTADESEELPVRGARVVPDAPEKLLVREMRVTADEPEELPVRGARIVPDAPEKLLVRETRVISEEPEDLAMRETRAAKSTLPEQAQAIALAPLPVEVHVATAVQRQSAPVAPSDVAGMFVAAAEAVADAILVSSGFANGEGRIVVRLRPEVLDGSEIHLVAKGGTLTVVVNPATRDIQDIIEANRTQLEQHLSGKVHAWRVSVAVKRGDRSDERV